MNHAAARRLVVSFTAVGLVCASFCGCEPEPFEGRVTRSRHFEYHDREEQPLCPLLMPLLDEYLERLPQVIGLRQDVKGVIRYYKFTDVEQISQSSVCPGRAGACATEESVMSPYFLDAHELAHIYAAKAWGGQSLVLFNEGTAVALSCKPSARYTFAEQHPPAWRTLLQQSDAENWSWNGLLAANAGYGAAGAFVTALAKNYGWARVAELYRRVAPGAYVQGLEREFARVMPVTLDQAWDAAFSLPEVATCIKNVRCALSEQPDGEELGAPMCVDVHQRPLALDVHAGVVLSLLGGGMTVRSCSEPNRAYWLAGSDTSDAPTNHWLQLPPDRYLIDPAEAHPARDLAVLRYLDAPLWREACPDAQPVTLGDTGETFIELPGGPMNGWLALAGDGKTYRVTLNEPEDSTRSVNLCSSCSPEAECSSLSSAQATTLTIDSTAVIKFDNTVSSSWIQLGISRLD